MLLPAQEEEVVEEEQVLMVLLVPMEPLLLMENQEVQQDPHTGQLTYPRYISDQEEESQDPLSIPEILLEEMEAVSSWYTGAPSTIRET